MNKVKNILITAVLSGCVFVFFYLLLFKETVAIIIMGIGIALFVVWYTLATRHEYVIKARNISRMETAHLIDQIAEGRKWAWFAAHNNALRREGREVPGTIAASWARSHADQAIFALLDGLSTSELEAVSTQYGVRELSDHDEEWFHT